MDVTVEKMQAKDWEAVRAIYREGIATGDATFEMDVPEWTEWDKRHRHDCRLVARAEGQIVGWAALSPVSSRRVYAGVAEVSIYVTASARGKGVGKTLLQALVTESERAGIWTLQGGIFPENGASIALHEACGFRQVGYRERLGQMRGLWRDVVLVERRSKVVGYSNSQSKNRYSIGQHDMGQQDASRDWEIGGFIKSSNDKPAGRSVL